MKKMGYVIGLIIGIPLFIFIINMLFFRGNNPSHEEIQKYINNSVLDTINIKSILPDNEQYIIGLNRRGRPSGFLYRYPTYTQKYNKHFTMLIFYPFDKNARNRRRLIGGEGSRESNFFTVRINQNQLHDPKYGSKENPVPVFAIDMLNLKWIGRGYNADPFHISEETNFIFVEQYLKHFMPKEEFKEMFNE